MHLNILLGWSIGHSMKILVTGGLGFIGSNFILKLLKESNEFEIINVDAELYGADRRNLSEIQNHE